MASIWPGAKLIKTATGRRITGRIHPMTIGASTSLDSTTWNATVNRSRAASRSLADCHGDASSAREATRKRCTRQHPPANLVKSNVTPASQAHTTNDNNAASLILVIAAAPFVSGDMSSIVIRCGDNVASDPGTVESALLPATSTEPGAERNAAVMTGEASMAVKPAHAMA